MGNSALTGNQIALKLGPYNYALDILLSISESLRLNL